MLYKINVVEFETLGKGDYLLRTLCNKYKLYLQGLNNPELHGSSRQNPAIRVNHLRHFSATFALRFMQAMQIDIAQHLVDNPLCW